MGAPACGDVMKLQVQIKDGVIVDAKFKTYGCGSAIASRCGRALRAPPACGGCGVRTCVRGCRVVGAW